MELKPILKTLFDKTCELFDLIDAKVGIMEKAEAQGKLSNILRYELISFLMCLSASDGRVSRVEAKLIRDYFDLEVYPGHIKEWIDGSGIGSIAYFEKVPESLKIATRIDNIIAEQFAKTDTGIAELLIDLFKAFGKEMVVADEKVKAEEQMAWSRYITMMTRYVSDNSKLYRASNDEILRPGVEINVDYEISLSKVGRAYTLYVGQNQFG